MKKMAHAKQRTNKLPARHLGQSCTSSRGTYVFFEKVGRLFLVDPNNAFESTEFMGSREAEFIKVCKTWMPGVSRWVYNQLQGSKLRKFGTEIVVEQQEAKLMLITEAPIVKPILPKDTARTQIFAKQCGARKVVLVLKEDGDPRNADVFHINPDGKVSRCRTGSKGQQQTIEQLAKNNWREGSLGQPQFASIFELIKSEEAAEDTSQKAA